LRPPDNLVSKASGLTGGATFAEVLDLSALQKVRDPLRDEIAAILRSHGQEI
jgi:hypothetical protein